MAADPSIYNALMAPPRSALDYAAEYEDRAFKREQMGQSRQMNALQLAQAQQGAADEQAYRSALAQAPQGGGADGTIQALLNSRNPLAIKQAQAMQKAQLEAGHLQAQTDASKAAAGASTAATVKTKFETDHARRQEDLQAVPGINDPQSAFAWIDRAAASGLYPHMTPETVAMVKAKIQQGGPQALNDWKTQAIAGGFTLQQQKEQEWKAIEKAQKDAELAEANRHNKATEGLTASRDQRADQRARESIAQGRVPAGYRQNLDGTMSFIPGGPADPSVIKKGAPTEFQGKSALFGARAQESDRILQELDGQYSPMGINAKQGAGKTPLIGGLMEAGANAALSPSSQRAEQAQRDFVNAVLRQESGASISQGEFDNARKQYFPQPGDSPDVIKQKAQNRGIAIRGLLGNAGNAQVPAPTEPVPVRGGASAPKKPSVSNW